MVRKNALTTVTVMPPQAATDAGKFVPRQSFEALPFWNELKEKERGLVMESGRQLSAAMLVHGTSGLAIGANLVVIQEALRNHHGAFGKFTQAFSFTRRSAYRYIRAYTNANALLPEPVLKAAMARGMNILGYREESPLGVYTNFVRHLPPPKGANHDEANRYLDQLEQTRKQHKRAVADGTVKAAAPEVAEVRRDPEFLKMQNFRGVKNALRQLPKRDRRRWMESLFGMLMTQSGIATPVTFQPEAIPDHFRQERGRPRLVREEKPGEVAATA